MMDNGYFKLATNFRLNTKFLDYQVVKLSLIETKNRIMHFGFHYVGNSQCNVTPKLPHLNFSHPFKIENLIVN